MSAPVLELKRVRKSFEQELVLEDISINVPEHTATVFIGASGSGKSTLLRCINLLEQIDDGEIKLDGIEIIQSFSAHDSAAKYCVSANQSTKS
jgi:polar amino acid transport system ATP-binding protein